MKHQTETFPPVGRLWKLPQLWKKAKRDAAFSHSCLDKPSDQTCSAYPQLPQARLSFYPLGKREQGRGACNGCLNWVRKTRHILRGWVNDGENPWVNDSENPQGKHKIHRVLSASLRNNGSPCFCRFTIRQNPVGPPGYTGGSYATAAQS